MHFNQLLRIMHLTAICLTLLCLHVGAAGISQNVSYTGKNVPLTDALDAITAQTGYYVIYQKESIARAEKITIDARNLPLNVFLDELLQNQPFTYSLQKTTVVLKEKSPSPAGDLNNGLYLPPPITIRGRIVNENGEPVLASIIVKGTAYGVTTNTDGYFEISNVDNNAILIISGINIETKEIGVAGRSTVTIDVATKIGAEEEVVINGGYYKTNKLTKTGNISRVDGKDIENQPVTSPLLALQGRAAGVDVYPSSGVPGASATIRIRGKNSLRFDGGYPLYVVDGVPIESTPVPSSSSLIADYDPLSSIHPADIQSIEILKDGDATSIYGSRGANGVVLITTKRANEGKTAVTFNTYRGAGKVSNNVEMLNTQEYLALRRDAFKNNNNEVMTEDYAPDFFVWDTTRYTNWQDELLGGRSEILDLQGSITGGNANTSFRFSGGYYRETTIFPGDFSIQLLTGSFSLNHLSSNKKFKLSVSTNYGSVKNSFFDGSSPVVEAYFLPPNAPELYKEDGSLNWALNSSGWSTWVNPLAVFRRTNDLKSGNLMFNSNLSYNIGGGFLIKSNIGYTSLNSSETIKTPLASYDPAYIIYNTPESQWTSAQRNSWIVEPQLIYQQRFGWHGIDAVFGATFQEGNSDSKVLRATGYASDALLGSLNSAATITIGSDDQFKYRYTALFARVGYDYKEKYLLSLTARRDGSSRFGANNRFGSFGSLGAAWIFSREKFIADQLSFISLGKIRGSVGTTGNDQIGDYKYVNTYQATVQKYRGTFGLLPSSLFNPDYQWEASKKLEAALELSFLNNRISFEVAWYRNRSSNLLIEYQLPGTTGFGTVLRNLDATVENRGFEYTMSFRLFDKKNFQWITSVNYSRPKNELIQFKELEKSSYANTYIVGQSLDVRKLYVFAGVDVQTGLYTFKDMNSNGLIDTEDQAAIKDIGRTYFGGINNSINYKGLSLEFLFQFVKQTSARFQSISASGQLNNIPRYIYNDRWIEKGDIAGFQKPTTDFMNYMTDNYWTNSDALVVNSSFVRLKTLSFSYTFAPVFLNRMRLKQLKLYVQGQNLFTATNYMGVDPEVGNYNVPPLRIISFGLQLGI